MTLLCDNRAALQKGQAGLHVFIAGVSAYPNLPEENEPLTSEGLGMRQLSMAALSAYRVYDWIVTHAQHFPLPLVTCQLLLSPSSDELTVEPKMKNLADACTRTNFKNAAKAWQKYASSSEKNMTIFYFAGHGIQRTNNDAVLLMDAFGDEDSSLLEHAVESRNLFYGMASSPAFPTMAQTQLYFIDCCRNHPSALNRYEQPIQIANVLDVWLSNEKFPDRRVAPTFYAAAPGSKARGISRKQTLFSLALLECLEGAAADFAIVDSEDEKERWHIDVLRLGDVLNTRVDELSRKYQTEQYMVSGGSWRKAVVCFVNDTPQVEIMFNVDPPKALRRVRVRIKKDEDEDYAINIEELPMPLDPHPYCHKVPAGFYKIAAFIDPPDNQYVNMPWRAYKLLPPREYRKVKVSHE